MKVKSWAIALIIHQTATGLCRSVARGMGDSAKAYFLAISASAFLVMLLAVVLAVWQERAMVAAPFVILSSALAALLYYRLELLNHLPLVELIVGIAAFTAWGLAAIGCGLRQRLRSMD